MDSIEKREKEVEASNTGRDEFWEQIAWSTL